MTTILQMGRMECAEIYKELNTNTNNKKNIFTIKVNNNTHVEIKKMLIYFKNNIKEHVYVYSITNIIGTIDTYVNYIIILIIIVLLSLISL